MAKKILKRAKVPLSASEPSPINRQQNAFGSDPDTGDAMRNSIVGRAILV